jgi:hypothetical protein
MEGCLYPGELGVDREPWIRLYFEREISILVIFADGRDAGTEQENVVANRRQILEKTCQLQRDGFSNF